MAVMKKHPFLQVDYRSTVKLSPSEERQLKHWLSLASTVIETLFNKRIIPARKAKELQLSLLICGDKRIKDLNCQHRNKDKVTDVLSFPAHEDLRKKTFGEDEIFLGDLAICHSQTKRQAKKFNIGYWDEFIHLFFHGVIHLLGYDHEVSAQEKKLMEKWEQLALKRFSEIKKKGP